MTIKPIKTERDYRKALKEIENLLGCETEHLDGGIGWTYWSPWWKLMSRQ